MARSRERERRGHDFANLRPHAGAVVDDHADGHGRIFVAEQVNRLAFSIVEDGEAAKIETLDKSSLFIQNGRRHYNEIVRRAQEMRCLVPVHAADCHNRERCDEQADHT